MLPQSSSKGRLTKRPWPETCLTFGCWLKRLVALDRASWSTESVWKCLYVMMIRKMFELQNIRIHTNIPQNCTVFFIHQEHGTPINGVKFVDTTKWPIVLVHKVKRIHSVWDYCVDHYILLFSAWTLWNWAQMLRQKLAQNHCHSVNGREIGNLQAIKHCSINYFEKRLPSEDMNKFSPEKHLNLKNDSCMNRLSDFGGLVYICECFRQSCDWYLLSLLKRL